VQYHLEICPSKPLQAPPILNPFSIGILGLWLHNFGVTKLIPKTELASTLENSTLFQKKPEYRKALQVVSVPERVVQFRVVWEDDNQQVSHCIATDPKERKKKF
jgi:hypothetical protein